MVWKIHLSFVIEMLLFFTFDVHGSGVRFSNTWAVKIRGGGIEKISRKHGFANETQVVSDYYIFDHRMVPVRSSSPSTHILERLLAEPEVLWAEQQILQPFTSYSLVTFNDPRWNEQWYMTRKDGPTYNVQAVWNMGFTGKGIVVAVVDEGLEKNHPELKQNFVQEASFDFIEDDDDPSSSDPIYSASHGNNCAGVIAAVANNEFCGVGIAYKAKIGGIRILGKGLTDAVKAKGLGFRRDYVDIYSNSWGPEDNGHGVAEIGVMTENVLSQGALKGRKGRGSIFVFGAGNGGFLKDSCSFNGLINSIYTIGITGVNKDGSVPRYGERCPGIMAVTYSKEIFFSADKVITASHYGECTDSFSASSAATAMASGLIALALESNKTLSWRDVQHIIIRSSRADSKILQATDWITNGANLTVSNYVGFGLMDAYRLVSYARSWATVPPQLMCAISNTQINRIIPSVDSLTVASSLENLQANCSGKNMTYLEHVQVEISLNFTRRGDLEVNLTSPLGTTSRLIQYRPRDNFTTLKNWKILTLHHWGENPTGVWKLTLKNSRPQRRNTGVLFNWTLILYGTETDPLKGNLRINASLPTTQPMSRTPTTVTEATERRSKSLSGAEVAGIVVGVTAFLAIVASVGWLLYRRLLSGPHQLVGVSAGPEEVIKM
ncbi:hypothetical protein ABFA07_011908 [Porites harrisoni]